MLRDRSIKWRLIREYLGARGFLRRASPVNPCLSSRTFLKLSTGSKSFDVGKPQGLSGYDCVGGVSADYFHAVAR
jgi:hypothetical protein